VTWRYLCIPDGWARCPVSTAHTSRLLVRQYLPTRRRWVAADDSWWIGRINVAVRRSQRGWRTSSPPLYHPYEPQRPRHRGGIPLKISVLASHISVCPILLQKHPAQCLIRDALKSLWRCSFRHRLPDVNLSGVRRYARSTSLSDALKTACHSPPVLPVKLPLWVETGPP
jgi:hypothetical protein